MRTVMAVTLIVGSVVAACGRAIAAASPVPLGRVEAIVRFGSSFESGEIDAATGSVMNPAQAASAERLLRSRGCVPIVRMKMVPAMGVQCPVGSVNSLAGAPGVSAVEASRPVRYLGLPEAFSTTQWIQLNGGSIELWDSGDLRPNGTGVGVAVIDSGVGHHTDLRYDAQGHAGSDATGFLPRDPSAIVYENWRIGQRADYVHQSGLNGPCCHPSRVQVADSDSGGGHGTHVAGLIAAQPARVPVRPERIATNDVAGTAPSALSIDPATGQVRTDAAQHGFAPGARLFVYSAGFGASMLTMTSAYDWLLYDLQRQRPGDPPIKIVNNSWSLQVGDALNSASLLTWQINKVIDEGVTVVFSAGNDGGDGTAAKTSPTCRIPRVVCVAAYDDLDVTDRAMIRTWSASSAGKITDPSTYPDVAAPGRRLTSTLPPDQYGQSSGTSMASPIVAACIALAQDAYHHTPGRVAAYLTPAQVESIVWASAYKYSAAGSYIAHSDPRYNGSNWRAGHGAIDCKKLVDLARATA